MLHIGAAPASSRISSTTDESGFAKSQLGFFEIRIGNKSAFRHVEKHECTKDPK
jgi:hypothetical protein